MTANNPVYVLDSFALLAYLEDEAGAAVIKAVLREASRGENKALLSLINLGEVAYIVERERGLARAQETLAIIEQLPIEILSVDRRAVLEAAHIKAHYPVADADAFAIASALEHEAIVLTGDAELAAVSEVVQIQWVDGGSI